MVYISRPTDYFGNQDINNRNSKTESVATETIQLPEKRWEIPLLLI